MARLGVDYETIKHAACKLLSQGVAPSVQKVREILGTGSNTTIAEHLKIWREEYAKKNIHHLPSHMPKELISTFEVLWQTAMGHAEDQLAAYKKALTSEHEIILQKQQDTEIKFTDLHLKFSEQQVKYEQLMNVNQTLNTELAVLRDRIEKKDEIVTIEKDQYEARLQRVYHEKDDIIAVLQETQKDHLALREKLSLQTEESQIRLAKERALQEQSENRWLNLIDQAKLETKELYKKIENNRYEHEKITKQIKAQLAELQQNIYAKDTQLKIAIEQANELKKDNKQLNIKMIEAKSVILKFESEVRLKKSFSPTQI